MCSLGCGQRLQAVVTLPELLQNRAGEKMCSKSCCSKQGRLGVGEENKYRKVTLLEARRILPVCLIGAGEEKKRLEN